LVHTHQKGSLHKEVLSDKADPLFTVSISLPKTFLSAWGREMWENKIIHGAIYFRCSCWPGPGMRNQTNDLFRKRFDIF